MIRFRCPSCKKKVIADDQDAGKAIDCKECGERITLPAAAQATAPATPPAASPHKAAPDGRSALAARVQGAEADFHRDPRANQGVATRSAVGLIVAAIVAGVFTFLWVLIAAIASMELGILAWGMGALVGLVAGVIARNPSPWYCITTACIAGAGVLGAKLIMAAILFAIVYGLDTLDDFDWDDFFESNPNQAIVMDQMIADGELQGEELKIAQHDVGYHFGDPGADELYEELKIDKIKDYGTVQTALYEKIDAKIETLDEAAIEELKQAARDRHAHWIEDQILYQATLDAVVAEGNLPMGLMSHAKAQVQSLFENDYEDAYFANTSLNEQTKRRDELNKIVVTRMRAMDEPQKSDTIKAALKRHPSWIAESDPFYAVLDQMNQQGEFEGELADHANLMIAQNMDQNWELDSVNDWEKQQDLQKQIAVKVNQKQAEMSDEQVQFAIAAGKERHPQWNEPFSVLDMEEMDEFRGELDEELAGDHTYLGAVKATFGVFDILWFILAIGSAYGTAKAQGDKANAPAVATA